MALVSMVSDAAFGGKAVLSPYLRYARSNKLHPACPSAPRKASLRHAPRPRPAASRPASDSSGSRNAHLSLGTARAAPCPPAPRPDLPPPLLRAATLFPPCPAVRRIPPLMTWNCTVDAYWARAESKMLLDQTSQTLLHYQVFDKD